MFVGIILYNVGLFNEFGRKFLDVFCGFDWLVNVKIIIV